MVKLSDFVFKYLESQGVRHVFTLTGGGIMHLVESMGNSNIEYICCHHEQACSIAAQAYGMYREQLNVCLVTTGPGGTNALTGAAAAYVDSTPMLFITGQVKREDFASIRGVRQFGAQENDIISMAKPVTKYAETVMEPEDILYHLQKAVYLAYDGRKGPVWLDIPLDIQSALIDETKLRTFQTPDKNSDRRILREEADYTLACLKAAKRPLIYVGQGMIASQALKETEELVKNLKLPVMATWRVLDFMASDDDMFFGSPGLQAPRYSNLLVQACDLLIVLGSRMDNMITAFNEEHFAFRAKKIIVDIDENEIKKLAMLQVYPVYSDVKDFVTCLLEAAAADKPETDYTKWISDCRRLKDEYGILNEVQDKPEEVDLYKVTYAISEFCNEKDTIVISSTSRCNTAGHIAFWHRKGQKTISSMGMGSMGFAVPSAIGAYYANGKNRVVVLEGDGSLQLNIQELQTIKSYNINAKLFIFNNNGYAAITTMQERNFNGHYVGSNSSSGVTMPDLEKIAYAYGLKYVKIERDCEIPEGVKEAMDYEGAVLCDITGSLHFDEIPKCISRVDLQSGKRVSALLENPYPYLSEDKLNEIFNMLLSD